MDLLGATLLQFALPTFARAFGVTYSWNIPLPQSPAVYTKAPLTLVFLQRLQSIDTNFKIIVAILSTSLMLFWRLSRSEFNYESAQLCSDICSVLALRVLLIGLARPW